VPVAFCGDGVIQTSRGEQCEDSLHDRSLPYRCSNCRIINPLCGDSQLNDGEECDQGAANSYLPDAACRPDCSRGRCGDGILDSYEQCDDGNNVSDDGCSRFCGLERAVPQLTAQVPSNIVQLPFERQRVPARPHAPVGDTGPAAVIVVAGGAAAGWAWIRRRRNLPPKEATKA